MLQNDGKSSKTLNGEKTLWSTGEKQGGRGREELKWTASGEEQWASCQRSTAFMRSATKS